VLNRQIKELEDDILNNDRRPVDFGPVDEVGDRQPKKIKGCTHSAGACGQSKSLDVQPLKSKSFVLPAKGRRSEAELPYSTRLAEMDGGRKPSTTTSFKKLNKSFLKRSHEFLQFDHGAIEGTTSLMSTMSVPSNPSSKFSTLKLRDETVMSDWGDAFEDSVNLNTQFTFMTCANSVTSFSDITTITNHNDHGTSKIPVPKGKVLAMCLTKEQQRFRLLNLKMTMEEVVETFLSPNGGKKLPISFTDSQDHRPRRMEASRMAMTIEDNLGKHLDASTQGLTFAVGPLNSKLCYKLCICDLGQLMKIFALTNDHKSLEVQDDPSEEDSLEFVGKSAVSTPLDWRQNHLIVEEVISLGNESGSETQTNVTSEAAVELN